MFWVASWDSLAECLPQGYGSQACANVVPYYWINILHYGVSDNVLYGDALSPKQVLTWVNANPTNSTEFNGWHLSTTPFRAINVRRALSGYPAAAVSLREP